MKPVTRAIAGAAFVCAALSSLNPSASAHPGGMRPSGAISTSTSTAPVEAVQYRRRAPGVQPRGRRFGGYRGGGRSFGGNAAIGIGSLIIGGIVLSEVARAEHRRANGSAWSRCAETFRSFERSTGMYTGYDGIRRPCPYLN